MMDTMYGRKSNLSPKGTGLIFMLFGVAFLAVAAILFAYDSHLRKVCTAETTATVIENVAVKSGSSSKNKSGTLTFAPVFEYGFGGIHYKNQSSVSSNPPKYEIGDTVKILVNPDFPETYRTDGEIVLRIIAAIFSFLGIIFTIVGIKIRTLPQNN